MKRFLVLALAPLAIAAACTGHGHHGGVTPPAEGTPSPTPTPGPSVYEHHHGANRRGVYVVPALTKAAAAGMHLDPGFDGTVTGNGYAQPLYVEGTPSLVFMATEADRVFALAASNGSVVWSRTLGNPIPLSALPCGNIDPLGITGTPVIDPVSRTMYLDTMVDAGGSTPLHELFALSIDDGSIRTGWPLDLSTISSGGASFDSSVQNQRGALTILNGKVYVPYGGHYGDCGTYYGWVVGVPLDTPANPVVWRSRDAGVALWAPGGLASDGTSIYGITGNAMPPTSTWGDSEAIVRLTPDLVFSQDPHDFYAPSNWHALDDGDVDLGGSAPVLVDLPSGPFRQLAVALGKDGRAYVADRVNLGGFGGELAQAHVASNEIINASASYTTAQGTYVVFKGDGVGCPGAAGNLTAVKITPGTPPTLSVAWCADQGGLGSPMVTQTATDGGDTIVWSVGSEGDDRLHGFDGDTGAVVFDGGGAGDQMSSVRRYITPMAAAGRIYVGGDGRVYSFTY